MFVAADEELELELAADELAELLHADATAAHAHAAAAPSTRNFRPGCLRDLTEEPILADTVDLFPLPTVVTLGSSTPRRRRLRMGSTEPVPSRRRGSPWLRGGFRPGCAPRRRPRRSRT